MQLKFNGEKVLLLGGSSELAIALTKLLIAGGLVPVLTYRSESSLNKIADELKEHKENYETAYLNLAKVESINSLFKQLNNKIDYMVDFIQADYESLVAMADSKKVAEFYAESLTNRFEVIKRSARAMLAKKAGRLIYVSSTAAELPNPGQGFYASAKLACEAIYRNLGIELGAKGITSVILRPGYISSGRGSSYLHKNEEQILKKIPLKRVLTVSEVAETLLFFLSESAAGFNAAVIPLDGGLTAAK